MITGHGGNIYALAQRLGCAPADIIDMSSNVNPLGPMQGLTDALKANLDTITALPEVDAQTIVNQFAAHYDVNPGCVIAANGTTQLIHATPIALQSKRVLIVGPTYSDYADACAMFGVPHEFFLVDASRRFLLDISETARQCQGFDTVFICNPNNPTGSLIAAEDLKWLFAQAPQTMFVIDEAYLPFSDSEKHASVMGSEVPNVIVLHSMSKIFRIPGLRIGFLIGPPRVIDKFRHYQLPWTVNCLAHTAVNYLMTHGERVETFIDETRAFITLEKKRFEAGLSGVPGLTVFPTETSFFLMQLGGNLTATSVCEGLAQQRVLIRNCANFKGLNEQFVRVSLKTADCNQLVIDHLARIGQNAMGLDESHQPASRGNAV